MEPKIPHPTQPSGDTTTQPPFNPTPPAQPSVDQQPMQTPLPAQPVEQPLAPTTEQTQASPQLPVGAPPPPPTTPPPLPPLANPILNMMKNKKLLLICGGALLLLVITLILLFAGGTPTNKKVPPTTKPQIKTETKKKATKPKDPSQTVVYGTWTSQQSVIRAIDTATSQETTLVSLPLTVKKISVLSKTTLLYIDHIDSDEYGQRISVYDLPQKQITINIPAETGLSIADYVLSPNKQYIALWEVSKNPQTNTLPGGQSGIYTVDLTRPTVTNKLYSEVVGTTPIHYPRAVLNDGTVFTDTYLPNNSQTDPGYENGLSVIDFDGTNQRDISSATAGTYSSQPVLSPDQKYLLFAGYDGSSGNGATVQNGIRQALITPNTIDLLNTKSLQRFQLPNLPPGSLYAPPQWDNLTGNPIITIISSMSIQRGVYAYDLGKQTLTKLPFIYPGSTFIAQLPKNQTLIGTQSTDKANLGNLGLADAYAFTQLSVLSEAGEPNYLSVQDPFLQYITTLPENYFPAKN